MASPSANQIQSLVPSNSKIPNSSSMYGSLFCLSTAHTNKSLLTKTHRIIDTGATNHMVYSTSLLQSITAQVNYSVKLLNGEVTPVTHIGVVQVTETIILHNVLCVPAFAFNLISARKLSKQLHCCLIFLSELCFEQGLSP